MSDEKTEKASPKKLKDAAEKGQTPNRKFIVEAIVLVTGVASVFGLAPSLFVVFDDLFEAVYKAAAVDFTEALLQIIPTLLYLLQTVLGLALSLGLLALFSQLLFNNFNFAPKSMAPKFEKFNPVQTLKGIFSFATLYNFARMLIVSITVSMILYFSVLLNMETVLAAAYCGVRCLTDVFPGIVLLFLILILMVFVLIAVPDFKLQNLMHAKQNKMSKNDVKQEHKGQEGDPQVKGQRKSIAREDARMPAPKDATHLVLGDGYAVALIYNQKSGRPPFIVAKYRASDLTRLISLYSKFGVPMAQIGDVARQYHKEYKMYSYADSRSAKGMVRILEAVGQLDQLDQLEVT